VTFEYHEPLSTVEALELLDRYGDQAKILAGGQSLMVLIRSGLVTPAHLVSLRRVRASDSLVVSPEGRSSIGCMATYRDVSRTPAVLNQFSALADACRMVGPIPVQNMGTLGGSLCHNAPGADVPPALLAFDATAEVEDSSGPSAIPLTEFFRGYFETVLSSNQLLIAISLPPPPAGSISAYIKFNYRLIDMAFIGVAVVASFDATGSCQRARIAIGGVDSVPFRVRAAELALEGRQLDAEAIAEAGRLVAEDRETISDFNCSATYRKRVLPVIVRRAFASALARRELPIGVSS